MPGVGSERESARRQFEVTSSFVTVCTLAVPSKCATPGKSRLASSVMRGAKDMYGDVVPKSGGGGFGALDLL